MAAHREHPVLSGLGALVGVTLVVGLILGLSALAATNYLGVGEDPAPGGPSAVGDTLFLPPPPKTTGPTGPAITLAPSGGQGSSESPSPSAEKTDRKERKKPRKQITLSASKVQVSPMEQVDLTGIYRGGEGAILVVQRFENGSWQDFGVTVSVSGETFATYIQTGQPGKNRFRVRDTDSRRVSNEVTITVQ